MKNLLLLIVAFVTVSIAETAVVQHNATAHGSVPVYSGQNRIGETQWTQGILEGKTLTGFSYEITSCITTDDYSDCTLFIDLVGPGNTDDYVYRVEVYQSDDHLFTEFYGFLNTPYQYGISADITFEVTYEYSVEGEVFDTANQTIHVALENTVWADIHYTINNGPRLSYRMTKNGDDFSQAITQVLQNGDVIEFYTLSQSSDAVISESQMESFTVEGLVDLLSSSYENNAINVSATSNLDWIDVHYTINGSSQYNYRMSGAQKEFSFAIPQTLTFGDVIEYSFTYALKGIATNSTKETVVVPAVTLAEKLVGTYENHLYDNNGGKNNYHYVEIIQVNQTTVLWQTRNGANWELYIRDGDNTTLDVESGSPYYERYPTFTVVWNAGEIVGVVGQGNELYNREN
ncbi:MAG: hypothetical protein OCC49_18115 [Fibrobacterales bacterium]